MTIEEHRRALERMHEFVNAHDLGYVDELYAEDVLWWYVGMPAPERGRAALKARDSGALGAFPDLHRVVDSVVVDEHAAAVRWRLSGTHRGAYGGFPATGRQIELTGCSVFEFENGRVQRLFVYIDTPALARQLAEAPI